MAHEVDCPKVGAFDDFGFFGRVMNIDCARSFGLYPVL